MRSPQAKFECGLRKYIRCKVTLFLRNIQLYLLSSTTKNFILHSDNTNFLCNFHKNVRIHKEFVVTLSSNFIIYSKIYVNQCIDIFKSNLPPGGLMIMAPINKVVKRKLMYKFAARYWILKYTKLPVAL